jgi:hypothetical protein
VIKRMKSWTKIELPKTAQKAVERLFARGGKTPWFPKK